MSPLGIVAQRYVGRLGGDGETLALLYVGRPEHAREFEVYYGMDPRSRLEPAQVVFRGGLPSFARHRRELALLTRDVDVVAHEIFAGALALPGAVEHSPMLDGTLDVRPTQTEQIRHMHSRGQRVLARRVLAGEKYESWVETGAGALDRFYEKLHRPYLQARFGAWAQAEPLDVLRRLHRQRGRLLVVAPRGRRERPACAAFLYDEGRGVLAYHRNGFELDCLTDAQRMAEHTTALELALFAHAREHGFDRINLGYVRAILGDGLFEHKRRLGAVFHPSRGSPRFRVAVKPGRRFEVFGRFPLLTGSPRAWGVVFGFDPSRPGHSPRAWRSVLKSYRQPGLANVLVWGAPSPDGGTAHLATFERLVRTTLDVADRVDVCADEARGECP